MRERGSLATRWLGVGLASALAVVTLGLAATGRLGLYINPDSSWFAVTMAVLLLIGAAASFALPLGAEQDHGHDHGDGHAHTIDHDRDHDREDDHDPVEHAPRRHPLATAATAVGGVAASGVVLLALVLPPATLSAELAMARDVGAPPLFAGQDVVTLASTGDTAAFGVGEWATVFATATNPDAFDGVPVSLVGFATPAEGAHAFDLTRLVITHCVIDAQPASLPVDWTSSPDVGQWVEITGTVRATSDGRLEIDPSSVRPVDEPRDPYEY